MDFSDFKSIAKQQIKGNLGVLGCLTILLGIISYVANVLDFPFVQIYLFLILPGIELGMSLIYLGLIDGKKSALNDIFKGFNNNYTKCISLNFLIMLFVTLWTFLLVIPGIIKLYSYSLSFYILADNPEMSALDAIGESRVLMKGHKFDLFMLHLSFLGWVLLGVLTLGIGFIYVGPYLAATNANFYRSLVDKALNSEANIVIID